jgi:hypothetical protein
MRQLPGTPIEQKNIELAKLVWALKQELDILRLIDVNVDNIEKRGVGKQFFWYLRRLAITAITLSICKIYEDEKRSYEFNSICGIINNLCKESLADLEELKFEDFAQKYNGFEDGTPPMNLLKLTFKKFRERYNDELFKFKTFRDKYAAHSEYGFAISSLPSYEVMVNLYSFASDFCELIYRQFIKRIFIKDLNLKVTKNSLKRLFQELGVNDIKTGMQ